MIDDWNPFDEGKKHLNKYNCFFNRNIFYHDKNYLQTIDYYLRENCPNNYCYIWVWINLNKPYSAIWGSLLGVSTEIALSLKIKYGSDLEDLSKYKIYLEHDDDEFRFKMERICQD